MADEPKKDQEDIQSILSDLDAILSDSSSGPATNAAPPPAAVPPAPKVEPTPPPKPVAPPTPVTPPPAPVAPPPAAPAPPPAAPPPAAQAPVVAPKIELAPRDGFIKPAAKAPEPEITGETPKAVEPPKPIEAPKAVESSKPVEPPKAEPPPKPAEPAKAGVPGVSEELPANTPKDQIRRVVYIYTNTCLEAKNGFATFLSQAARTISKKPLYLREVLSHEVGNASDPNALIEKARQIKAVAILAVVEGWPQAKIDDLTDACSRTGFLFRAIAPADTQKKSTAVDVIVDMMLLSGEA